ncbi:MAG: hypothetical protein JWL97_2623 [Gemmatimonadales bacterium]|nr:hypothetical protein [Gemmatimonadales bacterium]
MRAPTRSARTKEILPIGVVRLRTLIPVAVAAILGGCRGDNGPPTATLAAVSDAGNFSEQGPSSERDAGEGAPRAKHLRGSMVITHAKGKVRECVGADGDPWGEDEVTFTGTSVGDPELTGRIEMRVYDIYSFATNAGPSIATLIIRDPATDQEKARGSYTAWGPPGDLIYVQGTVVGRVNGENGGKLIAGWTVVYRGGGVYGEFDGAPVGPVPAGMYSGKCPSSIPWTHFENDVPNPANAMAASTNSRVFPRAGR